MIIQCDFDGTLISNNLSILLREQYAHADWQKIDADYLDGRLTVERSNQLQFALVREPKRRLQQFVRRHIEVRPGFMELVTYCQESAIPFVIVSSGIDFYIEPVLVQIGMSGLELHCGRSSFTKDSIAVSYVDPAGNIVDKGFKAAYLGWLKKRGSKVIYLGDGRSDLEAAHTADYVFATGELLGLLRSESIPCYGFSDFHEVLHEVRRLWES